MKVCHSNTNRIQEVILNNLFQVGAKIAAIMAKAAYKLNNVKLCRLSLFIFSGLLIGLFGVSTGTYLSKMTRHKIKSRTVMPEFM